MKRLVGLLYGFEMIKKNLDLDIHGFDVRGSLTISNCKAFFLTNKFHSEKKCKGVVYRVIYNIITLKAKGCLLFITAAFV